MALLSWVVIFPFVGFLILSLLRDKVPESVAAWVGVGSVGASALSTLIIAISFYGQETPGAAYTQVLWTWMDVDSLSVRFALTLDQLSMVMLGVITGVGFFIHLFASWYMRGDPDYERFFSYMNLFVGFMLILVLGDNLLMLYLGWEGVGLSSYLLIGFWYRDSANGGAARKAFVVTRVGDTLMAVGLFVLFHRFGTLDIQPLQALAAEAYPQGSTLITIACLLLLGGAVGKSAQLPLQTWLPDAMAGPTPVSALIHAATMVTAGVYLVARLHGLFELSPLALSAVGWIGGITLLIAGFTALTQTDIKKILAYSTMSQIGYMFLALGVGAWQPAVFHLMTHALFKALLFLAAGSVILACHHEQDIFKMGGLRKQIPLTFWCFLIGSLALVAFPGTAGFFSKDEILFEAWAHGHQALFLIGLFGAFLTAVYTFRLIFVAFFGPAQSHEVHAPHGLDHSLPLLVLAALSVVGGFVHLPLDAVLPSAAISAEQAHAKHTVEAISIAVGLSGIAFAWLVFHRQRGIALAIGRTFPGRVLQAWWKAAFGFDWLYDWLFVKPYNAIVRINRRDIADQMIGLVPSLMMSLNLRLARTQTGQLRAYAAVLAAGAALMIAAIVLL